MKKIIFFLLTVALMTVTFSSCSGVSVEADEEAALVDKPFFFGHGGVRDDAVETGFKWVWVSTDAVRFKIVPVKHEVDMDDLFSNDNTPLDFNTIVITEIQKGKTPILLKNYGEDWFNTNIKNYYSKLVRDHISQYSPFDLMSNREKLNEIEQNVLERLRDHIKKLSKSKEFPITIREITIGKAKPNKEQLDEMNRTARAVQAKQTQEREAEVQIARANAERQRAIADRAYMETLNLSIKDYISLKWVEMVANKKGANIDVVVGGASETMWNIRR